MVNTVKGMENCGVISQSLREILHEESMQIIEQQRQQHIEEEKYQHELPQDQNIQDQQKRIIIEQHCIEQQRIIEQQEQQGRFEQQQRVYFWQYCENYLRKQSQHLTTNFGELYTIEFIRCRSD